MQTRTTPLYTTLFANKKESKPKPMQNENAKQNTTIVPTRFAIPSVRNNEHIAFQDFNNVLDQRKSEAQIWSVRIKPTTKMMTRNNTNKNTIT
jgi:hypothetical protein